MNRTRDDLLVILQDDLQPETHKQYIWCIWNVEEYKDALNYVDKTLTKK